MKQKVVLIVSVVLGLLAAFFTRQYLNAKDREVARKKDDLDRQYAKIGVMAVNKDLPGGTVLTSSDLGAVYTVKSAVQGSVIEEQNYRDLLSKKLVRALRKGDIIHWSDIEGGGPDTKGLAGDIKKEMRAVSVSVSGAASVSGMVQPNDRVDVLGTFSFPSKTVPGEIELVTQTISQNVLVLATGKETAKSRLFSSGSPAGSSYNTVTLEVNPREAEMLIFLESGVKGRIFLTLRNPDDIYFEPTSPPVNFDHIQGEIEVLNKQRQEKIKSRR